MTRLETATFASGCFWCYEPIFKELKGVIKVTVGYAGGRADNPTYEQTIYEDTGHAESYQIEFDAEQIGYAELLKIFFLVHDPTQLNRQGNDVGTQYRSIVFYHDEQQKELAERAKAAAKEDWPNSIVTEIVPFDKFYPAEDYHQNYYENNPENPYCSVVISPKLQKFRQQYKRSI